MATITTPQLSLTPSSRPGETLIHLTYTVTFDLFDKASDQPYTEVLKVVGDDTDVGDPASAGPDDLLQTLFMAGPIRASEASTAGTLVRRHEREIQTALLDEDPGPDSDEIRIVVTLTPDPPRAVGPTESTLVTFPKLASVPDVLDHSRNDADRLVGAAGLVPKFVPPVLDNPRLDTHVIDQKPPPSTPVDTGTIVVMTLRKGSPQ
jgi:hypothetical protein